MIRNKMEKSKQLSALALIAFMGIIISECQVAKSSTTSSMSRDTLKSMREMVSNIMTKMEEYRGNMMSQLGDMTKNLSNVTSIPDKLMRAELSMLQDEIRMAQDMLNNPLGATLNTPQNLARMFSKMGKELVS